MSRQRYCDICKRPGVDLWLKRTWRAYVWGFGWEGMPERDRIDICEDCVTEIVKRVTKGKK